jgi:hypothetical protein
MRRTWLKGLTLKSYSNKSEEIQVASEARKIDSSPGTPTEECNLSNTLI